MLTRRLGATDLELSGLGFGAWAIGGDGWRFGWGRQDNDASIGAIYAALELGVNWIDTARVYGPGRSERVVAEALRDLDARPYVVTKCTRVWDDDGNITGSMRRDSIRRELEASLAALDGRPIDLYLIHQPKPDDEIEEGWTTLLELKSTGLVRHVGVSNFSLEQLRRAEAIGPVDAIEPPYSLLDRPIEREILGYCADRGIGVVAYSPMGSGLLTGRMTVDRTARMDDGDWRKGDPRFQEPQLSHSLRLAERLAALGSRAGRPAGAMACAWVIGQPAVTAAIVGFRDAAQVHEVLGADGFALDDEEIARVRAALEDAVPAEAGE